MYISCCAEGSPIGCVSQDNNIHQGHFEAVQILNRDRNKFAALCSMEFTQYSVIQIGFPKNTFAMEALSRKSGKVSCSRTFLVTQ